MGPGTEKKKKKDLLERWRGLIVKRGKERRVAAKMQGVGTEKARGKTRGNPRVGG